MRKVLQIPNQLFFQRFDLEFVVFLKPSLVRTFSYVASGGVGQA
jgi:hypothetical protein